MSLTVADQRWIANFVGEVVTQALIGASAKPTTSAKPSTKPKPKTASKPSTRVTAKPSPAKKTTRPAAKQTPSTPAKQSTPKVHTFVTDCRWVETSLGDVAIGGVVALRAAGAHYIVSKRTADGGVTLLHPKGDFVYPASKLVFSAQAR